MNEEFFQLPEQQCQVLQETYTHVQTVYDILLDEDIKHHSYYRDALHVLRTAGEQDLVRLLINSEGGYMSTAIAFANAIKEANCPVIAIIEGSAFSAASMIALCADDLEVKDYSSIMCHSASFGSTGTSSNIRAHVSFTIDQTERFIREVYKDFLTEEEVEQILNNREIWMDDEETRERWGRVVAARQADYEGLSEIEDENLEIPVDTNITTH